MRGPMQHLNMAKLAHTLQYEKTRRAFPARGKSRVINETRDPNTVLALLALPSKGRVIYL